MSPLCSSSSSSTTSSSSSSSSSSSMRRSRSSRSSARAPSMPLLLALAVAVASARHARGMTNGTLIPPYICDLEDHRIGGPTSLGGVLPYLTEDDAMMKVAGYHKSTVAPYLPQDLCTVMLADGATQWTATTKFMVASKDKNTNLLGVIAWVQDVPAPGAPRKIGSISDPGLNMIYYPYRGCGNLGQTIVHKTALDDEAVVKTQTGAITWVLGADQVAGANVEVTGVCVTDGGFGPFNVAFPANPAIANMFQGGANAAYDGNGKGPCPAMKMSTTMTTKGVTTLPTTSAMKSTTSMMTMTTTTTMKMASTTTAKMTGTTSAILVNAAPRRAAASSSSWAVAALCGAAAVFFAQ